MGSLTLGQVCDRSIRLSSSAGLDLSKVGIVLDGKLAMVVQRQATGRELNVTVRITAASEPGSIQGRMVVTHPEMEQQLVLPILGIVKR